MPTMEQMAKTLKVTRQAIYKKIKENGLDIKTFDRIGKQGKAPVYSDAAAKQIYELFSVLSTETSTNDSKVYTKDTEKTVEFTDEQMVVLLKEELRKKEEEIKELKDINRDLIKSFNHKVEIFNNTIRLANMNWFQRAIHTIRNKYLVLQDKDIKQIDEIRNPENEEL